MGTAELLVFTVMAPSPETVRRLAGRLTAEERAAFSRMRDPREADVRAVSRAVSRHWREAGATTSVAHAGAFGVVAVSRDALPIGVDVESRAIAIPPPGLVREVTSPAEFAGWASLPAERRPEAFLRLWTLKEAGLKARGAPRADGMAAVRVRPGFDGLSEAGWFSTFVDTGPGRLTALAVRGEAASVRLAGIGEPEWF